MNELEYDASTIGNHEFDYGLDRLKELLDQASFNIVVSNSEYSGNKEDIFKDFPEYYIHDFNGTKIAFIGIVTPTSITSSTPSYFKENGEFVYQAGQHTITYVAAEDDTYYSAMYNNNFGSFRTRPDFDWSYFPGVGTYKNGEKSMYYLYEVKEKSRTYKLVKLINLPYSSIVSSIQNLQKNYVTSSGMNHSYGEYDNDGNLIKQFDYTSKKYAYGVFKYSFNKFFFD